MEAVTVSMNSSKLKAVRSFSLHPSATPVLPSQALRPPPPLFRRLPPASSLLSSPWHYWALGWGNLEQAPQALLHDDDDQAPTLRACNPVG